jgi:hypothetical protein
MPNHSEPDRTPSVAAVDGKRATEGTELNEIAEVKSESSFHLNGCHISRVKLDRLWGLAREGFPSDSCVFIESTRKGKVESKVKSKSIDGLSGCGPLQGIRIT